MLEQIVRKLSEYQQLKKYVQQGRLPAGVVGLSAIHKAQFAEVLSKDLDRPVLMILPDEAAATKMAEDINTFSDGRIADVYPSKDFIFRDVDSASHEYEHRRLSVLGRVLSGSCRVVLCAAEAAVQFTIPPKKLLDASFTLKAGEGCPLEQILQKLVQLGYQRCDLVDGVCQFSVRGGILDVFPPFSEAPVRIEFWGDEIDTISYFDPDTQRRTNSFKQIQITPAREILFENPDALAQQITAKAKSLRGKAAAAAKEQLLKDAELLQGGAQLGSYDKYIGLAYERATIFDYFQEGIVLVSEYVSAKETLRASLWQMEEDIKILFEEGVLCKGLDSFTLTAGEFSGTLADASTILMDTFARSSTDIPMRELINLSAVSQSVWSGELKLLHEELEDFLARRYHVVVLAGTDKSASALCSDLIADGVSAVMKQDVTEFVPGLVSILPGSLSGGLEYPGLDVVVITHSRIASGSQRKKRKSKTKDSIKSLSDLTVGDYVVHVSHGIGIFEGIQKLDMHGVVKDYIKIRYSGQDILYVPVTQLDLVNKYIGVKDDRTVKLNKLNSAEWQKTRSRVKKAVQDMAKELTALYAKRQQARGYAFAPDTDWQMSFEERFEFEETDDQLRCIEEIKHDMESERPMERLLCGDVGFGKTEVALRAAFKCVMDSKQCAILVPTTILAWQHYKTVLKRMEGFPIRIELLSRFRSQKQQEQVIRDLRSGKVDIVIGTHRLVQKDIRFKDLGLVVIDEEQRFGVAHKEKLKELQQNVDILTLSATPIPRTLNMAMTGIRDMSVIEEAPQNRHPVQTYVLEHDMGILAEAIRKELRRGGQVFYLYNRIETITQCAARLQNLLPDARIVIAHGRMGEEELSEVWRKLLEHEVDILVCTTIIETGVDVPNCNTLIIEDADRMGLSQLYQIRGRVGRSNRHAFAYFTFKRGKVISDVAAKRLQAIREFTKFGSGFRIAMRDLEIRGAGNILGAQQHGHMEAVGYDMYLKLLSDAVALERGEKPSAAADECMIDIRISAHIPENYISNTLQRIDIYKKIADIKSEDDAFDVTDELIDRFGDVPDSVHGLIEVAMVRNKAALLGIEEIKQKDDSFFFYPKNLDMQMVSELAARLKGRVMLNASSQPYFTIKAQKNERPIDVIKLVVG
ncbi:transcription-repair coupling factor [Candidatus Soleaferrea massiliensis]|uniref:transcription-repair coupling factor n=1 Tax=Candidatus Soleaferrea massiliensis TaxID=1470354 RepID=UPI00058E8463|nr:transcription-repair coupling factor [Candidatus Soleaferrea massiliensis]